MSKRMYSYKEELKILARSMRLLWNLTPSGEVSIILWAAGNAAIPFINIYMPSLMIDELAGARDMGRLVFYVVLTLALNFILALVSRALMQRAQAEGDMLLPKLRLYLGEKGLSMDYRQVESVQTRMLRNRIEEAEQSGVGGVWNLYWQQNYFIEVMVKTILATVLVLDVFRLTGQETDSALVNWFNTPAASMAMAVCILVLSMISARSFRTAAQKLHEMWKNWPKHLILGNYYSNEYLGENGAGKDVRLYKQKNLIMAEFRQFFEKPRFLDDKIRLNMKYDGINLSITALATGLTYLFVSMKVLSGAFGIGSLVRFAGLIIQFVDSFVKVISASTQALMNNNYMRDVFAFLDMPGVLMRGHRHVENAVIESLEFDHVTFRYPDTEVDVLHDVSFRLTPRKNTALVGMNGSGKTTMIKLLCRLYDPSEGRILLNGIDIREYEYEEYLRLFAVVFQDFRLFSFTVGENTASGPRYDAARALYKKAPLMVLDEPTAALDPLAEAEVYRKFNQITQNKTAVYISHRLSSCRFCDDIVVLHQGRVVQQGSHDALVSQKEGLYFKLWQAQAQYYVHEEN